MARGPNIWVETKNAGVTAEKYNRKPVLLEGTFVFGPSGHLGVFPGEIRTITRIDIVQEGPAMSAGSRTAVRTIEVAPLVRTFR
jgi:hypothetical protein